MKNQLVPTHICKDCGALWRFHRAEDFGTADDSWSVMSKQFCDKCDSGNMDEQVSPLTYDELFTKLVQA
ncbi:TPA: hypothetical protein ACOL2D_002477 [Vibrio parahaemolyticus]|nr:hypothetical protein [Vibrio parahaemolyticus]